MYKELATNVTIMLEFCWTKLNFSSTQFDRNVNSYFNTIQQPQSSFCFAQPGFEPELMQRQIHWRSEHHVGGSITVRLVSYLTGLNPVVSVHTNNNILSCLVKSTAVQLESICTLKLPPIVSVLRLENGGHPCLVN